MRFLAAVGACWIGARILLLWPQTGSLPEAIKALVPGIPAREVAPLVLPPASAAVRGKPTWGGRRVSKPARRTATPAFQSQLMPPPADPDRPVPEASPLAQSPSPLALATPNHLRPLSDRWSASGWFVTRAGRGVGAAPGGGQLGGGQAGMRIAYMLAPRERIAAFGRITAPLAGKGREAAIGIEWRPFDAPLHILAEQRFGLDGTPGGTGLGIVAGLDTNVRGFRLEGYGQAGAIARTWTEPYADGAIRVTHAIAPRLSLGMGAWGGAQRDAQRLDIGPSATLAISKLRLSLDWRQRIAGRARPGSGLALSLGADF